MENSDNPVRKQTSSGPGMEKKKSDNPFFTWIKHNLLVTFLLLLIIVGGLFLLIRMNVMQKRAGNERQELISRYENQLDSLALSGMERTVKAFSWAVRSEMARQNLEQVDQFLSTFIQEQGILRIMLVNPSSGMVILSTDRKDEGTTVTQAQILDAKSIFSLQQESSTIIVAPIMGIDERLGVLIVEVTL